MKLVRKNKISDVGKFIIIATVWNDKGVRKINSKPISSEELKKYVKIGKDFLNQKEEYNEEEFETFLRASSDWEFIKKEIFEYKLPPAVDFFDSTFYEIAEDGIYEINLEE